MLVCHHHCHCCRNCHCCPCWHLLFILFFFLLSSSSSCHYRCYHPLIVVCCHHFTCCHCHPLFSSLLTSSSSSSSSSLSSSRISCPIKITLGSVSDVNFVASLQSSWQDYCTHHWIFFIDLLNRLLISFAIIKIPSSDRLIGLPLSRWFDSVAANTVIGCSSQSLLCMSDVAVANFGAYMSCRPDIWQHRPILGLNNVVSFWSAVDMSASHMEELVLKVL